MKEFLVRVQSERAIICINNRNIPLLPAAAEPTCTPEAGPFPALPAQQIAGPLNSPFS